MRATIAAESLSDQELLTTVQQLAQGDRTNLVALLVHIGELDERKLYLETPKPSLFAYCVDVLRMSEGATFKRIAAARVARRFPTVLKMIEHGEMHLSGLSLLAKHLTEANYEEMLARGRNKSKREIEKLVAQLCPKPDETPRIRRLSRDSMSCDKPLADASPNLPLVPVPAREQLCHREPQPQQQATHHHQRADAQVTASAPERYRITFTADEEFHDDLRATQALLKNQIPNGDIGKIMTRALRGLLAEVKKKKLGTGARQRRATTSGVKRPSPQTDVECAQTTGTQPKAKRDERGGNRPSRSRTIPVATRRAVFERDGGRCTFTNEQGTRCSAASGLEFHHDVPFGVGGMHAAKNIRLLCRPHNLHQARHDYGAHRIDEHIRDSRPLCDFGFGQSTFPGKGTVDTRRRPLPEDPSLE